MAIINNYFEVNRYTFDFEKLKKLRDIVKKFVKIYNYPQDEAIIKIKHIIEYAELCKVR